MPQAQSRETEMTGEVFFWLVFVYVCGTMTGICISGFFGGDR